MRQVAVVKLICKSYCVHGGGCFLPLGHNGLHDTTYCKWDESKSISEAEADKLYEKAKEELFDRIQDL